MISSVSFCSSKTGGLDTVCRIVENLDNRVDTVGRGSVEVIGRVINMISLNKKMCLADRKEIEVLVKAFVMLLCANVLSCAHL